MKVTLVLGLLVAIAFPQDQPPSRAAVSIETKTASESSSKAHLPDAPSNTMRIRIDAREAVRKGICTKEGDWYRCPQSVQVTFPRERVVSPSFVWSTVASSATMVADFETTIHAIQNGCREVNPIYGSRPDRARLYGIGIPLHAAVTWLTYRSKRSGYQYWWFAQASLTAAHALAAGLNASHC